MKVKTNVVLSVLVGGFPVITKNADIYEWKAEYDEFLKILPAVSVKGLDGNKKYQHNYEACRDAVLDMMPEFNKLGDFVTTHARKQISTSVIVDTSGNYTSDYLSFCEYMISLAQETTGKKEHEARRERSGVGSFYNQSEI